MKYGVRFKLNGKNKVVTNVFYKPDATFPFEISDVRKLIINKEEDITEEVLNVACQVVKVYKMITDIYVYEMTSTTTNTTTSSDNNGAGGIIFIEAFLIAILLAPFIIALGMHGKFLLKGLYKNVIDNEKFKKFRKTYITIGFIFFAVAVLLVVIGAIIGNSGLTTAGLYVLFFGNVIYFIIGIIIGNTIYKGQEKTK